jgi:GNAT superfamily N-acetyltransferase
MIEIRRLNKADLSRYITSEDYLRAQVIPISKHRALSQISNPRADARDILLLIAYENDVMLGYLGVLPDEIYAESNEPIHCGWMSCLWVDPGQRGRNIARQLIDACFESWHHRILLTEYTEAAGGLYAKTGLFTSLHHSKGRRWYVRSDLRTILPPKNDTFKKIIPVLKLADFIFNLWLNPFSVLQKKSHNEYRMQFVSNISADFVELIDKQENNELFCRSSKDLEWILQNPWIKECPGKNSDANKYHFTSVENIFKCDGIEIRNKDGLPKAFIIYTNRNGHLRLPYIYYTGNEEAIRLVCNHLIVSLNIKTITIYNEYLLAYLAEHPFIRALNKEVSRSYLISKTLAGHNLDKKAIIQDGDGDCAFT